jgi:hypothetical protein
MSQTTEPRSSDYPVDPGFDPLDPDQQRALREVMAILHKELRAEVISDRTG